MAKYDEVDAKILEVIEQAEGSIRFYQFAYSRPLTALCVPFATNSDETWRVVDRRLQALRKKGLIASTGKGWVKI